MTDAVNVSLGTQELRPWVLRMIETKVEQERKRASQEVQMAVNDMKKMLHNSLKKAVDALDKEISMEFASCRQEMSVVMSKVEEEAHARKTEAAGLMEEQRLHKTELRDLESRMAQMETSLRNDMKLLDSRNAESRKGLNDEVQKLMATEKMATDAALKASKKDFAERLTEMESRAEQRQQNTRDEINQQIRLVEAKADECSKELARLGKATEDARREERALMEEVWMDERRAREAEMAKEVTARKSELLALEERVAEDSRHKKEEYTEEMRQRQAQLSELDSRLQKEMRERLSELGILRNNLHEEAITRKNLSQSFQALERRAIKHIEEMVAHKAAVASALGSKGNPSDFIAVEQAIEQKAREADEKLTMVQEKMSAALLLERKNRKESMTEEYNARRAEITELGNAVGLDVAKLHDQLGQIAEAERRARDALARRLSEEREGSEAEISAELSRLTEHFHEFRGSVDAHIQEVDQHQRAVHEALGSKGNAKDLIAVSSALEQRAKEAETQLRNVRSELDSRCNKLAGALRESCNALSEEHEQYAAKVEAELQTKGSAQELLSVSKTLERKADTVSVESKVAELDRQLHKELADAEAEQAKLRAALAAPGGGSALLEVARELEVKAQELEKLREVVEQKSEAAELNVSALKDAIDSHADAMDVFSSDMAATVAKKLSSMQRALEGKADLSAAAACVHVSSYLKDKGIKAPRSKPFASDTARLSMEDINDIAAMQMSSARRSSSTARGSKRDSSPRKLSARLSRMY